MTVAEQTYRTEDYYEKVANKYRPIFKKIKEKAIEREEKRELLFQEIEELKKAGFGAVRLPVEAGGDGVSIPELAGLLRELGAADSNVPQSLRAHFGFTEMVLNAPDGNQKDKWIKRIANGDIVGNAWSEIKTAKAGTFLTKISEVNDRKVLNGTKYYSTGTIYADWILVLATDEQENNIFALVDAKEEGIEIIDDWDGFGQILTGSGTTTFTNTLLKKDDILPEAFNASYLAGFFQVVHLATLSGIAQAAAHDVASAVAKRDRKYTHASGDRPSNDPQILQVVGKVHSLSYATLAILNQSSEALEKVYLAHINEDNEKKETYNNQAEIEVSQGQSIISELTLQATTLIFDALGASAIRKQTSFDRYWRNARTLASHNPVVYKEKVIGDYVVNQTPPPFVWHVGKIK